MAPENATLAMMCGGSGFTGNGSNRQFMAHLRIMDADNSVLLDELSSTRHGQSDLIFDLSAD